MKKILLLLLAGGFSYFAKAQCSVTANATELQITCGESVTLSHSGSTAGNISFQEDFNNNAATGWAFTQQATFTNPCSPGGVDGTPHIWMGDQSGVPRTLETLPLNFGPAVAPAGGTICFDMLFAKQCSSCNAPCEGPDEPDEGVYLQYSVDNGATWVTIHYFDPNGGNDASLVNWNNWCFPIPAGALTNGVKFRWFQDADSGAAYDHWGIDNVEIIVNDPTVQYTWTHDGYTTGVPGTNPTPVSPMTTTTYEVTMTTSSNPTGCTDQITIVVVNPTFEIDLGNDTTICPGNCVTLNATAYELVSPASTPTFSNAQTSIVTGGTASMNINVQGLNTTSMSSGSVTSICLTGFNFSGTQICTTFGGCNCNGTNIAFGDQCNLNISSFNVTVTAPGGCSMLLVPASVATGTNYSNVCFVPAGGQNINGGGFPAAGDWNPSAPFSSLNGCDPNGVWTMTLNAPGGLGFGVGSLSGWSISFDDPELTAPVNFSWSPTTDMTNSTTLSPTICPSATTTYTLTVEDTDGCTTDSEEIAIAIGTCCDLEIDNIIAVNPGCTIADGQITIEYSGETTGLQFSIDGGTTFQSSNVFSDLAAGTYNVQIIDDANCPVNQVVNLASSNAPTFTTSQLEPACGASDGSISVSPSGGTAPYEYSIDGAAPQTSPDFQGLPEGSYSIVVFDDNNCQSSASVVVLTEGPGPSFTAAPVNPACGESNGSITITASGGTAPLEYSIDNGTNFQSSNSFTNLGAASYQVVVQDNNGCEATETVQLVNPNAPVINSATPVNTPCGASTGSITVVASGGVGTLEYSLDGGSGQPSGVFSNLDDGDYEVTVTDDNGCEVSQTVTVGEDAGPSITLVTPTPPNCGASDGSIVITATGVAPLSYSIDNGTTTQASGTFNNLGAATYQVVVSDANGCNATQQVVLNTTNLPNVNGGADVVICAGESVTLTANGAVTYTWTGGVTNGVSFTPATSGVYTVTGTDASGCVNTDDVNVTVVPVPDASFTPDVASGNPPLTVVFTNTSTNATGYVWEFGNGSAPVTTGSNANQSSTYNNPGIYTVQLTASNGNCTDIFTFPITVLGYPPFEMHIPNVFTPNSDQANNEFFIDVKNGKSISVTIFNRWGNKMFEMDDFADRWDGKDASEGVYFFKYVIVDMDGKSYEGHGHVTLVRE